MSYSVLAVCRPEVAPGFELAGLAVSEASGGAETAERIRQLRSRPDLGVILVEDTLYNRIPEEVQREFSRAPLPMLVPFPGPLWEAGEASAEAYIVELLRQVVGYRVRLR